MTCLLVRDLREGLADARAERCSLRRKSLPTWLLAEQLANDTSGPVHHHLYPSGAAAAQQSPSDGCDRAV
jgi:hypothetical protein